MMNEIVIDFKFFLSQQKSTSLQGLPIKARVDLRYEPEHLGLTLKNDEM